MAEAMTIWKFSLDPNGQAIQEIEMPERAEILHVGGELGELNVWALVNPKARPVPRRFAIVGTGEPAPEPWQGTYVGTIVVPTPMLITLVWHIFVAPEGQTEEQGDPS